MSSRSSRGPVVLSRSSSRSPSRKAVSKEANRHLYDRKMWSYLVIAIAVLVVIFVIIGNRYHAVHAWARIQNSGLLALALIFAVVLAAYATYSGHRAHSAFGGFNNWVAVIASLYIIIAVILILMAWTVYRSHNYAGAFYLSIVALVLSIIHVYGVWRVHPVGGYAAVPLTFVLAYLTYLTWIMADESSDCAASCCTTFEAVA